MTPRLKLAFLPSTLRQSSPTRPSSAIQISASPSRWAGTGTLSAETIARTMVLAVSMASNVPISGRSLIDRTRPSCWPSSKTMAFDPVTETIRPIETSPGFDLRSVGTPNCMAVILLSSNVQSAGALISAYSRSLTTETSWRDGNMTATTVPWPFVERTSISPP